MSYREPKWKKKKERKKERKKEVHSAGECNWDIEREERDRTESVCVFERERERDAKNVYFEKWWWC